MNFDFHTISEPTLLLKAGIAIKQIARMSEKAQKNGVIFRPHFKTHQSAEVAEWFREFGTTKITVSSLAMAEYFAAHNWRDITLAFSVNPRQIKTIDALAKKIKLNLLIENTEVAESLVSHLKSQAGIFIKIDTGYHRTGLPWDASEKVLKLIKIIENCPNLHFKGLLAHSGHSYKSTSKEQILKVYDATVERLTNLKSNIEKSYAKDFILSIGDTPCCSIVEKFAGIDEIRPGNFVFYDVMQYQLNACTTEDIALTMACPVVAKHESRQQIVIHGGAVHLSKDSLLINNKIKHFGLVVPLSDDEGWGEVYKNSYVCSVSQEHGIIQAENELFESTQIGDLVGILPVHSCLAVNLMKSYITCEGTKITIPHL
ncbi:MAG: alanine racemase [Calditrichaeota bacterium]|nr:MAG: alanine racemase [Calditrichota bacterium]